MPSEQLGISVITGSERKGERRMLRVLAAAATIVLVLAAGSASVPAQTVADRVIHACIETTGPRLTKWDLRFAAAIGAHPDSGRSLGT